MSLTALLWPRGGDNRNANEGRRLPTKPRHPEKITEQWVSNCAGSWRDCSPTPTYWLRICTTCGPGNAGAFPPLPCQKVPQVILMHDIYVGTQNRDPALKTKLCHGNSSQSHTRLAATPPRARGEQRAGCCR